LFSHNYCSSAEALCRTALEATINLYYCSLGNTEERIVSYAVAATVLPVLN
jgi:hypothetical protein